MLYILIFLLLTLTALGKDCPCKSETHKNEFNKAEVVAHVKVVSWQFDKLTDNIRIYNVQFIELFKSSVSQETFPQFPGAPSISTQTKRIFIEDFDKFSKLLVPCGKSVMETGNEYLIAPIAENQDFLVLEHCTSLNRKWSDVDSKMLSDLRNKFN